MTNLVYVPVGSDRFAAQVIAEACRSAGIRVELLTADQSGVFPALAMLQAHRLLVAEEDAPRVEAIVAQGSEAEA